jgi:glycosyltransferase involved in cell wall biosynthesis
MRFLLAGHFYGRGGIQTHLRWMARLLSENGHSVFMLPTIAPSPGDPVIDELPNYGVVAVAGSNGLGGRLAKRRQLPQMAAFIRDCRPHVYFFVGTGWLPMVLRPIAAPASRAIFFEVMSGHRYRGRLDPRVLVRYCVDEVIGQSPRVSATFRRAFSWGKPVASLPAIPEPLERIAHIRPTERHRVPMGRARAALFSRLEPHKRALWLVQQWPQLKNCLAELHIHGSGSEQEPIERIVQSDDYRGRVFCHGPYPEGQAYVDLLASYDLTLLPTIGDEGAPLVLLESIACGVPFVASGTGGIPDYGRDNPNCQIAAREPDRFVYEVQRMAERLDSGSIDHQQLQRYYHDFFAHQILRQSWLDFLTQPSRNPFAWPGVQEKHTDRL